MRTSASNPNLIAQLDAYCRETGADTEACLNEALQDFLQCAAASRLETFRKNQKSLVA